MSEIPKHEQAVLGNSIVSSADAALTLAELTEEDWSYQPHRDLFRLMRHLVERGAPIDSATLSAGGNASAIGTLEDNAVGNHEWHISQMKAASASLRYVSALGDALSHPPTAAELQKHIAETTNRMLAIAAGMNTRKYRTLAEIAPSVLEQLDGAHESGGGIIGISTGYGGINRIIGGLTEGDLVVLAARTSTGKTALALNMASHISEAGGHTVLFASLEMTDKALALRIACARSNVTFIDALRGSLPPQELAHLKQKVAEVNDMNFFLSDSMVVTVEEIRARALELQSRPAGLGVIFVDYLQLMTSHGKKNRVEQVSEISRGLKRLAVDLAIPVVAVSQLNRQIDQSVSFGRPGAPPSAPRKPRLSDLRESGSIEQDADVVIFLHKETANDADPLLPAVTTGMIDVIVAKNRRGPLEDCKLVFVGPSMKFTEPYK